MTHVKTAVVIYWRETGRDCDEFEVRVEGPGAEDWDHYVTDEEQDAQDEADGIAAELGCDVVWAS